jgi:mono/diheme cytochrome c family protein
MQSFTCVMPGETLSCVGCHEHRALSPETRPVGTLQALKRTASVIEPFKGFPDVVDFHRDVQPVLDKYCVSCHRPEKRDGYVLLNGDLGLEWSISYYSLLASLQVADGRNGLGNQPPRTIGSSASPLLKKGDGTHYNVKYAPQDWRTLWLWTESGATYAGTYAGLRNEKTQGRQWAAQHAALGEPSAVFKRRCLDCHTMSGEGQPGKPALLYHLEEKKLRAAMGRPTGQHERLVQPKDPILRYSAHVLVNTTRPEQSSLLLGPLAKAAGGFGTCGEIFKDRNDPDYLLLLGGIRKAKTILDTEPRFGTENFKPNYQYVRELKKYGVLPANFDLAREPLNVFEADQRYWRTLWTTGGGE